MTLTRLRLVTLAAPIAALVIVGLLLGLVLNRALPDTAQRLVLAFGILVIGAAVFSTWVFHIIRGREKQVQAADTAIAAIAANLDPAGVLQHIVDSARHLVDATYGALGVADDNGRIVAFITSGITAEQRAAIGPLPLGKGLLGALIHEAEPIRLRKIQDDSRSSGFPPNHPPMTSLLGVPITLAGEVVGDLYLTDKIGGDPFTAEDEELLVLLARHAAVAITNARLYAEAQEARDELRAVNLDLEAKVAERGRRLAEQSREITRRVLQAQEEERRRIARELHDETAQSLATLLINIDVLESRLPDGSDETLAGLERLRTLARRTLDETRALSHDLRPAILDDVGLAAALAWFGSECETSFGVKVEVQGDMPEGHQLTPDMELALFRIAQEAINNAAKHSGASGVCVTLDLMDGRASLEVRDNGRGFDPERTGPPTRSGGLGLYGVRERAELIGGELEILSALGQGTTIRVVTPTRQTAGLEAPS